MAEKSQILFLWKQIRDKAEGVIPPVSFNTFIKDLEPVDVVNRRIYSQSAHRPRRQHHHEKTRRSPQGSNRKERPRHLGFPPRRGRERHLYAKRRTRGVGDDFKPVPVNKNFTFDSFVVGSSNKFVYAAAKSVAEHPGESFNPLFIYGESGLGKTHLVQAIANYIAQKSPEKRVLYTTCENFLNEFIDSMISGKISSRDKGARFRLHYRNVDILMIDDIQFLAKKPGVQEEFFHTFNELSSQNKQIVLTSDRPPKEIATLEERLRTRFEGGLIADIQPPDLETKIAILKRKALERKCPMPDDVLEFLANDSGHDVRNAGRQADQGAVFASKLHEEPISLGLAKLALSESVSESGTSSEEITPDVIISSVCGYYKYKREDLLGKGQKSRPRQGAADLRLPHVRNALPAPHLHRQRHGRPRPHHDHVFAG